jgi:peptide/nickel transport system substrate-binding protein
LAESWEYNADRSQITWHLREGVKFHDGTEFDAEALKWNYERLMDPESTLTSSGGGTFGAYWTDIEVLDKYTLRVTTGPDDEGEPTVFRDPTSYGFYVVSPAAVEEWGDQFGEHPVGTGPYKFVKWERGVEVVAERNPDYFRAPLPYPDEVVFRFQGEDNVRALALATGDIDVAPYLAPKEASAVEADPDLELQKNVYGEWSLNFNCAIPPFDKLENREAVVYALDYEAINHVVFYDMAQLTNGIPIPSVTMFYDASIPILEQDLDRAKAKLAEAGNPDGFKFLAATGPGALQRQMMEMIQSLLLPVGIEMEIQQVERGRYMEILRTERNTANAALVGIRLHNVWENYEGIYNPEGAVGFTNWPNEEAPGIVEESRDLIGTGQDDRRMELAKRWFELFSTEWPGVAFTYFPMLTAYNKRVQGLALHCEGMLEWRGMWVDPTV